MSLWLTAEELEQLTGRKKKKLQREALVQMGVQFRLRPVDGFPLVRRSLFDEPLTKAEKRREPRLDLIQ